MKSASEYLREIADKIDGDQELQNTLYIAVGVVMDNEFGSDFSFHHAGALTEGSSFAVSTSLAREGAMRHFVVMQRKAQQ